MADLESVISGAMETAYDSGDLDSGGADTSVDTSDASNTDVNDAGTAENTDTGDPVAGAEADAAAKAAQEQLAAVEDAFAKEHGINPQDQRKRENRIPYSQVKKIVANAEKKLAEMVLGPDAVAKFAADKPFGEQVKSSAARFTELETENQSFRTQIDEVNRVEQIMLQRPEQFLELLPHINPKFAELLGNRSEKHVEAPKELPKPDVKVKLPDGTEAETFSTQGLQQYIQGIVAQTEAKVRADIDARFKPIKDREQAALSEQQQLDQLYAQVQHARQNWRSFKEWEKDIQQVMAEDRTQARKAGRAPKLDLNDAYLIVRDRKHDDDLKKLTLDQETMRKKIVDEINKRPKSTAAGGGVVTPRKTGGGDAGGAKSIEDIIRESAQSAGVLK
jgi:hypothetical protein